MFYNGDLIYASRYLDSTGNCADSFTPYWVKRNLQEAFKRLPFASLDQVTSMDQAIATIHRQAGKKVESKLMHVYLHKLGQDEVLSQPRLSLESTKEMLPNLPVKKWTSGYAGLRAVCWSLSQATSTTLSGLQVCYHQRRLCCLCAS